MLQDILENDDLQLDDMFISSLIYDILRVSSLYVKYKDKHIKAFFIRDKK